MGGKLNLYALGQSGVNLVKNPLQLGRDEATQLQNTIWTPTQGAGGLGKRGGLTRLNTSVMNSGASVLAASSVPLPNPFSPGRKYLYAGGFSPYWFRSSDGTTWASTAAPQYADAFDQNGVPILGIPPVQPVSGRMIYVSAANNDQIWTFDGTSDQLLLALPPVTTGYTPYATGCSGYHNGEFYIGTNDNPNGRVYKLDPVTGQLTMIIGVIGTQYTAFSIFSYIGRLFVGVSDNIGAGAPASYVYTCDPDTATAWTVDSAALLGVPVSMVNFLGNLYIGCGSRDAGVAQTVYKRTPSGTYSSVLSDASPWNVTNGGQLAVFSSKIFAYQAGVIYSSTDGASWSSEIDVYTTYTSFIGRPGRPCEFGGALYWPFESTGTPNTGRILKRTSGGVWSSVYSGQDLNGLLTVLELP